MKKLLASLFLLAFAILPATASAQFTVPQGGTGYNAIQSGSLLFGNTSLRLGTSTALQWNNAASRLTVTNASTTVLSADTLCLTADDCITSWPAGGTGISNIGPAGQFADGPNVTLATSSDTNIGLTITGSGDTLTFTSNWIGTLADARISDTITVGASGSVSDSALSANVSLLGSTIGAAELASADFGSFTCNGTTCTIDSQAVTAAMLANADFGDFTVSGGSATIDANAIALATDTTGNYVATVSSSGSITVANSGSENAGVTVNLNMGNANTWTALQTFANTSATNATTSAMDITSLLTFGGVTGNSWDDFCTAITGGAGLCDGTDSTGSGGTGLATSTAIADTYIIYGTSAADVGAEAAFTYDDSTNTMTVGLITLGGDTIDEFVGTGLQISSGDLQTTLGTAIDSAEITNGTIVVADLASADFGDFTCNGTACTIDSGVVAVADLASADFGDWTCNGSACTVDANSIALTTDTTGDYTAGVSSSGSITVGNGTGEGASATVNLNMANANTWTALQSFGNASTSALSTGLFWAGQTATTSINGAGTITIGGNIVFAGDTIDELVGTGLTLSSGDLTTTLGVAIDSSEITDGTIVVGDLSSADFGDFTCNGSACTIDSGVVAAADLATADFGEFSCSAGTCTIDANTVALTTDTTGNYVATLADDGQTTVTVTNGSTEGGAATLRVIDVVCTDCLTTTEIADSYLLNNGDVGTGNYDFGGASFFEIPNGTAPTADDPGEIAHDTSDNQLIVDDFVMATAVQKIWSVTVASTSPAFIAGGLLKVPTEIDGYTITAIRCSVESGTSKVVAVEDASANSTEDITCATTVTSDDGTITNATATAAEEMYIDFGSTSGSVNYVSISVFGTWTRE